MYLISSYDSTAIAFKQDGLCFHVLLLPEVFQKHWNGNHESQKLLLSCPEAVSTLFGALTLLVFWEYLVTDRQTGSQTDYSNPPLRLHGWGLIIMYYNYVHTCMLHIGISFLSSHVLYMHITFMYTGILTLYHTSTCTCMYNTWTCTCTCMYSTCTCICTCIIHAYNGHTSQALFLTFAIYSFHLSSLPFSHTCRHFYSTIFFGSVHFIWQYSHIWYTLKYNGLHF